MKKMEGNTDACVKGYLLLSSSLLFPLVKYIFLPMHFVLDSCWRLFHQSWKKSGCCFPWRAMCQSLGSSVHSSILLLPAQPTSCSFTELLTAKSKGYFTTDYKYLKPEQMSCCLTAKDSPLAQAPVLPSISLIWQDHRLQPHLKPFICISFL